MPVVVCMLRGINLAKYNRIRMDALRDLCESLNCRDVQTYLQSGNVIFRSNETDLLPVTRRIERAIERTLGFRIDAIARTAPEMRDAIARNPFATRSGIDPKRLLVTFLASDPGEEARKKIAGIKCDPEEMHVDGREAYTYFPNGMARPKLSWPAIERILKTSGTGRNWNSVTKITEIATAMEAE